MELKRWKDLSDKEKENRLKKICGAVAVIFVIILLIGSNNLYCSSMLILSASSPVFPHFSSCRAALRSSQP